MNTRVFSIPSASFLARNLLQSIFIQSCWMFILLGDPPCAYDVCLAQSCWTASLVVAGADLALPSVPVESSVVVHFFMEGTCQAGG